jgi:hypothetical protein
MFLLVTFHPNLVTADYGVQSVVLTESLCDIWSELHAYASFARATAWLRLWICPQHFHH